MSEIKTYDFKIGDVVTYHLTGLNYILYKIYPENDTARLYYGIRLNKDGQYKEKKFFYSEIKPARKVNQVKTYQCERNTRVSNEARALIKLLDNLNREADKAGGSGWTLEQLEKMTAADLLCTLCTNNLRFKYEPLGE